MQLKIIVYHYIHNEKDYKYKGLKGISIKSFKNQLKSLLDWGKPLNLGKLIETLYSSEKTTGRFFYLTFDDGLKDHYINVFPILKKHGLSASFFPLTLPLMENRVPVVEKQRFLQYCFTKIYRDFLNDFYRTIKDYNLTLFKKLPELNKKNIDKASSYLKSSPFYSNEQRFYRKARDQIIPENDFANIINLLFNKYVNSEKSFIRDIFMTLDELREMQNQSMDIGCHTHSHAFFNNLSYNDQLKEIKKSSDFLSKKLKKPVQSFAYPYGVFDEKTVTILKKLNFKCAFTTENYGDLEKLHPFKLYRIDAKNSSG